MNEYGFEHLRLRRARRIGRFDRLEDLILKEEGVKALPMEDEGRERAARQDEDGSPERNAHRAAAAWS